jgi:probable rRNA maturation factor
MPDGRRARARLGSGRAAANTLLRVVVTDEWGRRAVAPGLAAWLRRVAPARARGVLTVALISDGRIRDLNRRYRGKDYATDVLSFPASARMTAARAPGRRPAKARLHANPEFRTPNPEAALGDVVIARQVARRQARAAGHDELTELKILSLHGLLHLLGYDHEHDEGRMLRIEQRLRRKGGLREGLIERARPAAGTEQG